MSSSDKMVIIIEDEPDTAEMYAEMIRISGYEVIKYFAGSTAVAQIAEQKPSAVVLDLMMPDVSGLEVIHFMKKEPHLAEVPVIIVSAKTLPKDIEAGLNAGATAYLTKPVSFSDLINAINSAIELKGERKT
ncbi:MAG: response regulator [Chloroflexota bacterium]|nr:MAG: response regulator [Chloroflexota bacterium]